MKKLNKIDLYVIFSITVLIIYAVAERTISALTGLSADTLTTCVYAAFGGEILSCCLIKLFKLKNIPTDDENLQQTCKQLANRFTN